MNGSGHWFWTLVTVACLLWYSTITVYVAFRGVFDIRFMLARLRQGKQDADAKVDARP